MRVIASDSRSSSARRIIERGGSRGESSVAGAEPVVPYTQAPLTYTKVFSVPASDFPIARSARVSTVHGSSSVIATA